MTWFKFLAPGAVGPFSGHRWPSRGDWATAEPPFDPCRRGLHLLRPGDLPLWLHEELYVVEVDGPVEDHDSFVLAGRARLVRRVDAWRREAAQAWADGCAQRSRDLTAASSRLAGHGRDAARLREYAGDAATYAGLAGEEQGWASAACTAGYIAAVAAGVAAAGAGQDAADAVASERARQARWLADRVVADLV